MASRLWSPCGLFADPSTISKHLTDLSGVLPDGATDVIGDQSQRLSHQGGGRPGFAFLLGLLISISANAGVKALFDALNVVNGEREKRSSLKLNAILLLSRAAHSVPAARVGSLVVLPLTIDYLDLTGALVQGSGWSNWVNPGTAARGRACGRMMYRYGPSREKARRRWLTWDSAFAAIAWLVVSVLFWWSTANFGSDNKTYGSLGAVVGLMTWMWLSSIVILLGAEFDAEMEHQTAQDTTTGAPRALGARGARMADTIGKKAIDAPPLTSDEIVKPTATILAPARVRLD